jgi:hypothetical protein
MEFSVRESATEAAGCTPTDWAALGARILAAASQATAIHMATAVRMKAQERRAVSRLDRNTLEDDSVEPNL